MRLVEPRKHIRLSAEVAHLFPEGQFLSDQWEADNWAMGVWEDNGYYLVGHSHFDERPEEIAAVLTRREWRQRERGRLDTSPKVMLERIRRAQKMYPALAVDF